MGRLRVAVQIPALALLAIVTVVLIALILYERARFAELRERLRGQVATDSV